MLTLFSFAFSFAIFNASDEISIDVIVAFGMFFANVIGMHPVPVPISKMVKFRHCYLHFP